MKSVTILSKTSNKSLAINTPLMMTWGIEDFVNDQGESNGKYKMPMVFPNPEFETPSTNLFLTKLKEFENQVIEDAMKNQEAWFGEDNLSRDVIVSKFTRIVKYPKIKGTKKLDMTKSPSISANVPFYADTNKWPVQIYDVGGNLLFPSDANPTTLPGEYVPRLSKVKCILNCGSLWISAMGWGVTFKLVQCIVKTEAVMSIFEKCHLQMAPDEMDAKADVPAPAKAAAAAPAPAVETMVDDSDEEPEPESEAELAAPSECLPVEVDEVVPEPDTESAPEPDVESAPEPESKPAAAKKVVKKAAAPPAAEAEPAAAKPVAKKVVKKAAPASTA
jgi:hypothetical protein